MVTNSIGFARIYSACSRNDKFQVNNFPLDKATKTKPAKKSPGKWKQTEQQQKWNIFHINFVFIYFARKCGCKISAGWAHNGYRIPALTNAIYVYILAAYHTRIYIPILRDLSKIDVYLHGA